MLLSRPDVRPRRDAGVDGTVLSVSASFCWSASDAVWAATHGRPLRPMQPALPAGMLTDVSWEICCRTTAERALTERCNRPDCMIGAGENDCPVLLVAALKCRCGAACGTATTATAETWGHVRVDTNGIGAGTKPKPVFCRTKGALFWRGGVVAMAIRGLRNSGLCGLAATTGCKRDVLRALRSGSTKGRTGGNKAGTSGGSADGSAAAVAAAAAAAAVSVLSGDNGGFDAGLFSCLPSFNGG